MRCCGLAALLLVLQVEAQVAEFVERYAAAERLRTEANADAAAYRPLYQRAVRAFLHISSADAAYAVQLPAGGFAAFMAEDYRLSADLFAQAIAVTGASDFLIEYRLRAVANRGDLAEAVALARTAAAEQPHRDAVGRFLVTVYGPVSAYAGRCLRQGERELGLWVFRSLAVATGENALATANLALGLRYLGEFDEAGVLYRRAVEKAPEDSVLWNDYGIFAKAMGDREAAVRAFRKSIELEARPGNSAAWTNMMFLWRNDKRLLGDARKAVRQMLQARPQQTLRRRLAIDAIVGGQLGVKPGPNAARLRPGRGK